MKNSQNIFKLVFVFYILVLAINPSIAKTSPQEKSYQADTLLNKALTDTLVDDSLLHKALTLSSEAVNEAPNDINIRRVRAKIYLYLHEYQSALQDYQQIIAEQNSATDKIIVCMLLDKNQKNTPSDCYLQASTLYLQDNDTFGSLLSRLLAGDTSAEVEAEQLINSEKSPELKQQYILILRNFDHDNYINTILP